MTLRFDNRVIVITGSGRGIGLEYAKFFASRGAKLLLNDLGQENGKFLIDVEAEKLRKEFKAEVATNHDSVEQGEKIIAAAVAAFGRVDVLVNNAGILRDKSLTKMTAEDWDLVIRVHLTGTFRCTLAAWPHFRTQKFGRVINTGSSTGLYGNFGQANYAAAKAGIHGFTLALAREGDNYNIKSNTIAPVAATRMTQGIMPDEVLQAVQPKFVVPLVALLAHEDCPENGGIFEVGGGWVTKLRLQRAEGAGFPSDFTPEDLKKNWGQVSDFERQNDYPSAGNDSIQRMFAIYEKNQGQKSSEQKDKTAPAKKEEEDTGKLRAVQIAEMIKGYVDAGDAKEAAKKCNAMYLFNVVNKAGSKSGFQFWIKLKSNEQKCERGVPFENPDSIFTITEQDLCDIFSGDLEVGTARIRGKLNLQGDSKKAALFSADLFPKPTKENLKKYAAVKAKL